MTAGAPTSGSHPSGFDPSRIVERIAELAETFAWHAGVGGMETAGSIISFLAKHPERTAAFLDGSESLLDWPIGWHEQGRLSWHAMNGKVVSPEYARRSRQIKKLEKGA